MAWLAAGGHVRGMFDGSTGQAAVGEGVTLDFNPYHRSGHAVPWSEEVRAGMCGGVRALLGSGCYLVAHLKIVRIRSGLVAVQVSPTLQGTPNHEGMLGIERHAGSCRSSTNSRALMAMIKTSVIAEEPPA